MAKYTKLDFSRINSKRVTILVHDVANAQPFVESFLAQNFTVEVATEPSQMYTRLCEDGLPGLVLISSQCVSPMVKMMPDFLVKRFKIPVIYFQETTSAPAPDLSATSFPPEIWSEGLAPPEMLVEAVKNFSANYDQRVLNHIRGSPASVAHDAKLLASPAVENSEAVFANGIHAPVSEALLREVREICIPQEVKIEASDVIALHACRVADPSGKGYFVFAFPVRANAANVSSGLAQLEEKIQATVGADAGVEHLDQAVTGNFLTDLMAHADEVINGLLANQELIVLFFRNRGDVEEPDTRIVEEHFLIPMEEWWVHLPLPCHAYVWMSLNHRRVLYVRPGHSLRQEAFDRLNKHGIGHLAVDPTDFSDYRKIREMVHIAHSLARIGLPVS